MQGHAGKHVLIVDDEESVRLALKRILRAEGLHVEDAANAIEALALARRMPFDLVITDLVMPGPDGLSLLSNLKTIESPPKVILITAYGEWDTYLAAMNEGAFDYLTKPLKRNQIVLLVRHALGEGAGASSGPAAGPARGTA
jgi:two-component system response regulator HydG